MTASLTLNDKTKRGKGITPIAGDGVKQDASHIYAAINEELALLMSGDDKIIFGPAEDFEYKAPLEDFHNSQKT